jgi:hypothetical protein
MKKMILVTVILLLAAGNAFAGDINLGDFPVGQWLDPNFDAVWDFSTGNIRILDLDGKVIWDFNAKGVEDFAVSVSTTGPSISFTCPAAEKTYRITKPLTDMDLVLEIDRAGKDTYKIKMKKQ